MGAFAIIIPHDKFTLHLRLFLRLFGKYFPCNSPLWLSQSPASWLIHFYPP